MEIKAGLGVSCGTVGKRQKKDFFSEISAMGRYGHGLAVATGMAGAADLGAVNLG